MILFALLGGLIIAAEIQFQLRQIRLRRALRAKEYRLIL